MKFSVLLPVYFRDKAEYLRDSLRSIYHYQILKPAEILILVDGPIPLSIKEVIELFLCEVGKDIVKVIYFKKRNGLAKVLNTGLKYCSNEIIARMDADDVSRPDRFLKQIEFLEKNPDVDVLGGYIKEWDEKLKIPLGIRKVPTSHSEIVQFAKYRSPFNHMTVIFKKRKILDIGGYPEDFRVMQDYALWCKAIKMGLKFANIPEILVDVRAGNSFFKRRKGSSYLKYEIKLFRYLTKIGFWGKKELVIYGTSRIAFRSLPSWLLSVVYRYCLRSK